MGTTQTTPAVVIAYGASGLGKTADLIYSFPNGFFFAPKGALKPGPALVGHAPKSDEGEIKTIDRLIDALPLIAKAGYDAAVVDDFSLMAEHTANMLVEKYRASGNNFKAWGVFRNLILTLRERARELGIHVAMNAHEIGPRIKDGVRLRGGPSMPGKSAADFPVVFDVVVRAVLEPTITQGWPIVYSNNPMHADWFSKDRHNVVKDKTPMNMGEILRVAGYKVARAKGMEWMDDVVEAATGEILKSGTAGQTDPVTTQILQNTANAVAQHFDKDHRHIRWVIRDTLDRVWFRRSQATLLADYGLIVNV